MSIINRKQRDNNLFVYYNVPAAEYKLNIKQHMIEYMKTVPRPNVLYSGGIDSELIVETCIAANIEFDVSIMRYVVDGESMNDFDINYAIDYCNNYDVNYTIYELDLNWFLEGGTYIEYAIRYQCNSPQLCCHMWLMDCISGTPILGGDMVVIRGTGDKMHLWSKPFMNYCYDSYFTQTNREGFLFLEATPEIIVAGLLAASNIAQHEHLIYDRDMTPIEGYSIKCAKFRAMGFEAKPKPSKYTGFEHIRQYYSDKYNEQHTIREFNNRFRKPIEHMISEPELIVNYSAPIQDSYKEYQRIVNGL